MYVCVMVCPLFCWRSCVCLQVSAVGVENVDLSSVVGSNHFNYNRKMPEILNLLDLDNCSKYIVRGDSREDSSSAPAAGVDEMVYGTTTAVP